MNGELYLLREKISQKIVQYQFALIMRKNLTINVVFDEVPVYHL
jgi:hypothetical protein